MSIEIIKPRTLEEALEALAGGHGELRPVAGATDATLRLRMGKLQAGRLLCVADLEELGAIATGPSHLEIGAAVRVADLMRHEEVRTELPALLQAASQLGSPQIRSCATVGGNIGNASPAADLVPPLIALGAEVALRSAKGSRSMPLEDLFVGPGRTKVEPDELIVAVKVPRRAGAFQSFAKFGCRGANVISIASAALCLVLEGKTVREARAAYGCCGPTPLRARGLEAYLAGKLLDGRLVSGVAEVLRGELKPIDDVRGSARYKRMLAVNATEDALSALVASPEMAA